jgi:hypothetical protein
VPFSEDYDDEYYEEYYNDDEYVDELERNMTQKMLYNSRKILVTLLTFGTKILLHVY